MENQFESTPIGLIELTAIGTAHQLEKMMRLMRLRMKMMMLMKVKTNIQLIEKV
jgi:hypothetical protein